MFQGGHKDTKYWRCSVRYGKNLSCRASLVQKGEDFELKKDPVHDGVPGIATTSTLSSEIQKRCVDSLFKSAQEIVEDLYRDLQDIPVSLPSVVAMPKRGNRKRQALRPPEFNSLEYELKRHYLPSDFLVDDLEFDGDRHLILATPEQLETMKTAKSWFLEGFPCRQSALRTTVLRSRFLGFRDRGGEAGTH